jgi:hypothetical protein
MKRLTVLALFFSLLSCSRSNELCHCIQESEALNKLSNELLYAEEVSPEQQDELMRLRTHIDSLCAPFQNIGTEELYKMRNACIDQELLDMQK